MRSYKKSYPNDKERNKWAHWESNPESFARQANVLPLNYEPIINVFS